MYIMEKRRPQYPLREVQKLVAIKGCDSFTLTALTNARLMGLIQEK